LHHAFSDETSLVETGSVILGGTKGFGFDLHQQYFHKSVILILDHDKRFTKGIILNRPSSTTMTFPDAPNDTWKIWWGGDVAGLGAPEDSREINCLHCLVPKTGGVMSTSERLSMSVVGTLQMTTLEAAREIVKAGEATVDDFWTFVGGP
jgi:putative transcriptional regulator